MDPLFTELHVIPSAVGEKVLVRSALRYLHPGVRLDLLEPLIDCPDALVEAGLPLFVPIEQVEAFCKAVRQAAAEVNPYAEAPTE